MKVKNVLIMTAGILLAALVLACESAPPAPITDAQGVNVSGVASATAPSFGGTATVTLTVVDGFITNVHVSAPGDTTMMAAPVIAKASTDMVRFNTPHIDAVSGSTTTSLAVNQAAAEAMARIVAGAAE
ncbi:MAG: FMN-binding protein [Treponema sp.]|nr:FMN-binding protein [Treponema sp.]